MPGRDPHHLVVGPLLAAVVALPASACGQETSATRADGLAVARYEPAGSGGDAALLNGSIEALEGCLVVRPDDGSDTTWVPVFASNDELLLTVTEGEDVELGGGEAPGQDDNWDLPMSCPSGGPFWIVAQPEG